MLCKVKTHYFGR